MKIFLLIATILFALVPLLPFIVSWGLSLSLVETIIVQNNLFFPYCFIGISGMLLVMFFEEKVKSI